MSYSLCDRTVTVYRLEGDTLHRQVVQGCYYAWQDLRGEDAAGVRWERKFLLVMPGAPQRVFAGDRIYDGIGPELTVRQWQDFVPARVPGLGEAAYAVPWFRDGELVHTEAGRK